uniref:Uncharacterized protein n=1 Tax=Meloidogyne enterolobii TaxID=390850 RepID=A0A6V7W8A6_MELEN|nr:unnamed protein product [Meloidogyne enterolobii]
MHECISNGLVINRDKKGLLCWQNIDCGTGHLRIRKDKAGYCGERCQCPAWTNQCSFYIGPTSRNSTLKNEKVKRILNSEEIKKRICSIEPNANCAKTKSIKEVDQIELYDGSKILVNNLNIIIDDLIEHEFMCIGKGPITGSAKYCEKHHCYEKGTKFCYYTRNEIAFFETRFGNIPIRAWGKTKIKIYDFIEKKEKSKCEMCEVKCTSEGIQITSENKLSGFEMCLNQKCEYTAFPEKIENKTLAKKTLVNDYVVLTSFFRKGEKIKEIELKCNHKDICKLIDCTFCWEYLKNPHCYPEMAMISLGIAIYFLTSTILMTFKIIKILFYIVRFLVRGKFRCIRWVGKIIIKYRNNINKREESKEKYEIIPPKIKNSKLPMKIIVTIIVFSLIKSVESLTTITAKEEKCTVNRQGERTCLFEDILELNLNPHEQTVKILLNDHMGKLAGTIDLEVHYTEMICTKVIKFYTRTWKIGSMSVKRCYSEGSCSENKCSQIKANEKIEELKDVNKFPGISQCVESDGGWFQGCFYTLPACTFYRFYAMPTEKEILEIFTCEKWEPVLRINETITDSSGNMTKCTYNLNPGMKMSDRNMEITVKDITMGVIPMLSSTFVSNKHKIAKIDTEMENILRKFKCKSMTEAKTFLNCSIDPTTCHCRPADNKINCDCKEIKSQNEIFLSENSLPFSHNGILIKNELGNIIASTELSSATFQLKLSGMRLKTEIELNKCLVTNISITGCYDCNEGANIELTCSTDFGKSLANIICPSTKILALCDTKGIGQKISTTIAHAEVEEKCEVFCGLHPTTFFLKGRLAAVEMNYINTWRVVGNEEAKIESSSSLSWLLHFDFFNLLYYLVNPTHLIIFIFTLLVLLFMFYCLLPLLLRLLLTSLIQSICPRSVEDRHVKII